VLTVAERSIGDGGCHRLEIEAVFRIGRILKVFELLEQESVAFEAVAAVAIVGMG